MDTEHEALITELRDCLGELRAVINSKNEGKHRLPHALETYDGDGKLFEALATFKLKAAFDAIGASTAICGPAGEPSAMFVMRGGPGHLTREPLNDRGVPNPGFIAIWLEGSPLELHNGVEWPDRLVGGGTVHELDLSIAEASACNDLSRWYTTPPARKADDPAVPRPLVGVEAKFHVQGLSKAIGREMTGLAYATCPTMFILLTSTGASEGLMDQIGSLPKLRGRRIRAGWTLRLWNYKERASVPWPSRLGRVIGDLLRKRQLQEQRGPHWARRKAASPKAL
ncbi:hypothetical protein [Rhizobium binxianense]|jgi:hypothetical protein